MYKDLTGYPARRYWGRYRCPDSGLNRLSSFVQKETQRKRKRVTRVSQSTGLKTALPTLDERDIHRLSTFIDGNWAFECRHQTGDAGSPSAKKAAPARFTGFPEFDYVFSDQGSRTEMINMIDAVHQQDGLLPGGGPFEFLQYRNLPSW
jgi:hypothetical protein